ncbi:hypothetical protein KFE25_010076 [Diacronema lutheri]|uniref:Uncharacterized protein n=1 Tax=Diacronema lutheri TaxID=2081491 RepID=A0A8J6CEL6_DIALT|nr:hypothetical protein KFE25_010076 [Diacronema lutheri]
MPAKRALRTEYLQRLRVLARRLNPIVRVSRLLVPVVVGVARRDGWRCPLQLFNPDKLLAAIQYVIAPPRTAQKVPEATATLRDLVRGSIEANCREALLLAGPEPNGEFSTTGLLNLLKLSNREYVTTLGNLVENHFWRALLHAVRTAYEADFDARRALMRGASGSRGVFGRKVAAVARAALRREETPLGGVYPNGIASWVMSHMPKYDHSAAGKGTTPEEALAAAIEQNPEAFHAALCELERIVVDLKGVPIVSCYPGQPLRCVPALLRYSASGLLEALGEIKCGDRACSWSALQKDSLRTDKGDNCRGYIELNRSHILNAFVADEYVGPRSKHREISSFATDFAQLSVVCGEVDDAPSGAARARNRKRTRAEQTARNGKGRGGRGRSKKAKLASSGAAGEPSGEGARAAKRLRDAGGATGIPGGGGDESAAPFASAAPGRSSKRPCPVGAGAAPRGEAGAGAGGAGGADGADGAGSGGEACGGGTCAGELGAGNAACSAAGGALDGAGSAGGCGCAAAAGGCAEGGGCASGGCAEGGGCASGGCAEGGGCAGGGRAAAAGSGDAGGSCAGGGCAAAPGGVGPGGEAAGSGGGRGRAQKRARASDTDAPYVHREPSSSSDDDGGGAAARAGAKARGGRRIYMRPGDVPDELVPVAIDPGKGQMFAVGPKADGEARKRWSHSLGVRARDARRQRNVKLARQCAKREDAAVLETGGTVGDELRKVKRPKSTLLADYAPFVQRQLLADARTGCFVEKGPYRANRAIKASGERRSKACMVRDFAKMFGPPSECAVCIGHCMASWARYYIDAFTEHGYLVFILDEYGTTQT